MTEETMSLRALLERSADAGVPAEMEEVCPTAADARRRARREAWSERGRRPTGDRPVL